MSRGALAAAAPARPERESRTDSAYALGEIGLTQFAPYLMNRIMGRYNKGLREALRARGLTTPQMRALAVLAVAEGLTVNEVAVLTVTEQSTMSRTLDALEGQGLVRREAGDDGRVRKIYLTREGRTLFEDVWPLMRAAVARMFAGIGDAEYAAFVATLQKVLANVRHHEI